MDGCVIEMSVRLDMHLHACTSRRKRFFGSLIHIVMESYYSHGHGALSFRGSERKDKQSIQPDHRPGDPIDGSFVLGGGQSGNFMVRISSLLFMPILTTFSFPAYLYTYIFCTHLIHEATYMECITVYKQGGTRQ